jgi:hypothetical protein
MIEEGAISKPSAIEFEMAYPARVAIDRITFAIRQTEKFGRHPDQLREAAPQLIDAMERLEAVDRGDRPAPGRRAKSNSWQGQQSEHSRSRLTRPLRSTTASPILHGNGDLVGRRTPPGDEPGVLKIRLGPQKSLTRYSVPDSVARRVHTRLFNPAA